MGTTPENLKTAILDFLTENADAATMTATELYKAVREIYPCGFPEFAGTILLMQLKDELQTKHEKDDSLTFVLLRSRKLLDNTTQIESEAGYQPTPVDTQPFSFRQLDISLR